MRNSYERFLDPDNFILAYERLKRATRNLYKTIYAEDLKIFGLYLNENIESLIQSIREGIYTPEKCQKIFIPKKGILVRPLSMLSFVDLLVYQAMVNIIANHTYRIISPYYDKVIFGNILNDPQASTVSKLYFYRSWKKKWRQYNHTTKKHFEKGYNHLSEFDIASFYDTIDHNILCELLRNRYHIEGELLTLLSRCLETWTEDSNHKTFKSKHGIPQGPISSAYLAELYLFYLDEEIRRTARKLDFKYLRYVDDIRIMTRDELTSKKLIAALDLISRDLGLIPQGSKIVIKKIEDIDAELKIQISKFSNITREYKFVHSDKPKWGLSRKTHKKLKKRFMACFDVNSGETYLDKTEIGFSLFKLNADEDVKATIIDQYQNILPHFDGVLYYLKKHFPEDEKVIAFVGGIISDDTVLFKHLVALCFKHFPELPFDEKIYRTYTSKTHRHWLVNYYMVGWLYHNDKTDLLQTIPLTGNHYIERALNAYKFESSNDMDFKKDFVVRLLRNPHIMIALQGLYLRARDPALYDVQPQPDQANPFVRYALLRQSADDLVHTLKKDWGIQDPAVFFNRDIWAVESEYEELQVAFRYFMKWRHVDPAISILHLNTFNRLVFHKICGLLDLTGTSSDFGADLASHHIDDEFPICQRYWTEINHRRNQSAYAHPYDKYGKIRIRISRDQMQSLVDNLKDALEELCRYRDFNKPGVRVV